MNFELLQPRVSRISTVCLTLLGLNDLFLTIFLIFIFLCTQGFVFPNASALSLAAFGHTAGSASALLGAIQMTIGACTSALVGVLQDHTALPMTGVLACCAIGALSVFLLGKKIIIRRAGTEIIEEEEVEMISTL